MAGPLKLEIILSMVDKAMAPLRGVDRQSKALAASLKQSREALRALERQQQAAQGFRRTTVEIRQQQRALQQATEKADAHRATLERTRETHAKLGEEVKLARAHYNKMARAWQQMGANDSARDAMERARLAFEKVSRTAGHSATRVKFLADQMRRSDGAVDQASARLQSAQGRLDGYRQVLDKAGIGTDRLGRKSRELGAAIGSGSAEIDAQRAKLKALGEQQSRQAALKARAATLAGQGAVALGAAYGVKSAMGAPLHEVRGYETTAARIEALGLGKEESSRAIQYARQLKTRGTSVAENTALMLDATTAFGDTHHAEMVMPTLAKMKFANKAMFGEEHAADTERKFMDMLKVIELRGGLSSEADFKRQADMVQRVITATGGRVGPEEWLNFIKTGGVAAKGLDDKAMYYQLEPLISEMGGNRVGTALMSAYQNVYQGKTTKRAANLMNELGLIADPSKVKHDKVGQIAQLGVGAIKGGDLFQKNQFEWMEKVLLPSLAAKGITGQKQVLDAIGGIFSNRTASGLFAQMYLQREQVHKNARLNAGAFGIDEMDSRAQQSMSGRETMARAKLDNGLLAAGKALEPAYIRVLEMAGTAVEKITTFMEKHPALAQALAIAAVTVGVLAAGLGGLALTMSVLAAVAGPVGAALRLVGTVMLWLGRMMLTNPIGIVVTLVAVAAYLIYRNWDWLRASAIGIWQSISSTAAAVWGAVRDFLVGLWDSLGGSFGAALATIGRAILDWSPIGLFYRALAAVLSYLGVDLPGRFSEFGGNIIRGLADGITNRIALVRDAIGQAADGAVGWFKDKLGIRSPSRVFIEAGSNIAQGAALGIDRTAPQVRAAALGMAAASLVALPAMALPAVGQPAGLGAPAPAHAPLASARNSGPSLVVQGDTVHLTIQAGAGVDPAAIAQLVRAELARHEQAKAARLRGAYVDYGN